MNRLAEFMAARASEIYCEPRDGGHDYITAQMAEIVAKLLPTGACAIDVGCGQGPALEWFSKHGFNAHGITTNDDDLAACRTAGFDVHRCDMHTVGEHFGVASQDLVWARHVLEHSPNPFFVLHEFARVLKPGGILYAEMPDPQTPCRHFENRNHYSVLTLEMWISLIQRAGFEILETRRICLETPAGSDVYHSIISRKI